jgi:hypothetical protein
MLVKPVRDGKSGCLLSLGFRSAFDRVQVFKEHFFLHRIEIGFWPDACNRDQAALTSFSSTAISSLSTVLLPRVSAYTSVSKPLLLPPVRELTGLSLGSM